MILATLYLYLQFLDKQQEEEIDDDLDYRALESGYVSYIIKLFSPLSTLIIFMFIGARKYLHMCQFSPLLADWFLACDLEKQVAVTPLSLSPHIETDIQMAASDWISAVIPDGQ